MAIKDKVLYFARLSTGNAILGILQKAWHAFTMEIIQEAYSNGLLHLVVWTTCVLPLDYGYVDMHVNTCLRFILENRVRLI